MSEVVSDFVNTCHSSIFNGSSESNRALAYLFDRGISEDSIIEHVIGLCHTDVPIPDGIKKFGKDSDSKTDYSRFIAHRLIAPVFGEFGDAVGLATRYPSHEKGHKWWNLPKPFYKGNHLYLLNRARKHIFDENKVYITEGYVDALMMYQKGIKNVVALMGTALTLRKIGLIARYCNNVCLCLDIDVNEAGQKAQMNSIASLYKFSFCDDISVIDDLPIGEDPASYILSTSSKDFLQKERILKKKEIDKILQKISSSK